MMQEEEMWQGLEIGLLLSFLDDGACAST